MTISVVIPSYNRKDCILDLLRDLYAQEGADFEVVIVDDASPDGTVAAIRDRYPQVKLLVNEKNAGPCVSRNRAVMAAQGEFIVGLDSDVTLPDTKLLAKVRDAFLAKPEATGFAFRVFAPDGVTDDTPRWWHPVPIERGKARMFETDYFSGTAYAFRRTPMIAAGLYPEIFYMHYEEVELAFRVLDGGGRIFYHPDLTVVHHANPVSRRSLVQVYLKPRNQILLAVSCFPLIKALQYAAPRAAMQCVKAVRGGHFGEFVRAMKDAVSKSRQVHRRPLAKSTLQKIQTLRTASEP